MLSYDYRNVARQALKGFWGISLVVAAIAMLLGGISSGNGGSSSRSSRNNSNSTQAIMNEINYFDSYNYSSSEAALLNIGTIITSTIFGVTLAALSLVVVAIALGRFIIGGCIEIGYNQYNINLIQQVEQNGVKTLFEKFNIFGKAFALRLLMFLFTFLWSLLFIIPGIIASYRYSMAPYLMAENPELSPMEAINLSKEIMNGRKADLFRLNLSFIGWFLLLAFIPHVGLVVYYTYYKAAEAAFYLDTTNQLNYVK